MFITALLLIVEKKKGGGTHKSTNERTDKYIVAYAETILLLFTATKEKLLLQVNSNESWKHDFE